MTMIDRIGRFRGRPVQGVIKPTTNGFPSFNVTLEVTEYFDEKSDQWVSWAEYGQEITAYLCLFNATKALLNYEQVMKAFLWDGTDMAVLQSSDYGDLLISFEVEENEYKGKTSLKVNWVDAYDAEGRGGSLTPMDTSDLKNLQAQYSSFMVAAPAAAPAKAPAAKAPAAAKPKTTRKPRSDKGAKRGPRATAPPTAPPVAPAAPAATPDLDVGLTQDTAWVYVNEAMEGKADVDMITKAWLASVAEVSNSSDMPADNFTGNEWEAVRATAIDMLTV